MKKEIIALLTLLCALYSCADKKPTETVNAELENSEGIITLTHEQFEKGKMTLTTIQEKLIPDAVQANGIIDVPPENKAIVSASLGGYIKSTPLLIGDVVKKGQALVTLENPEFIKLQQEYLEVKQQMVYLQSEYDRQTALQEENITSKKRFLKAESDFKTTRARYNGLKKQLTMLNFSPTKVEQGFISSVTTIYAPISGSISEMNVNKGTYVSPASTILEIINNDHIHLELSVFEKDIMDINKGQPIRFRIPESSAQTFEAEVYLIGASIGEDRTIKVHGHLKEESQHNFLTGMFVSAEIIIENKNAKVLPSAAIVEQDGKFYVLRMLEESNGEYAFEAIEVEPENTVDGFTAIKDVSSLSKDDRFLEQGAFDIF